MPQTPRRRKSDCDIPLTATQHEKLDALCLKVSILETAVLGVPDSEDKGLMGYAKETYKYVKSTNGRTQQNKNHIWRIYGGLAVVSVGIVTVVTLLSLNVW